MKAKRPIVPGKTPHTGLVLLLAVMSGQAYLTLATPHAILLLISGFSIFCVVISFIVKPLAEKGWISNILFLAICAASMLSVSDIVQQNIFRYSSTEFFLYWGLALPLLSLRLLFADNKRNRMLVPFLSILCFAALECLREMLSFSYIHSLIFFLLLLSYVRQSANFSMDLGNTRKILLRAVSFVIVLMLGFGISLSLKGKYTDMYFLFAAPPSDQISNLDSSGRMHDLKGRLNSSQIVLRIQADFPPGYLRNNVFASFDGTQWLTSQQSTQLFPDEQNIFLIQSGNSTISMQVYPALQELSNLPHPLGTKRINCKIPSLSLDQNGTITANEEIAKVYTLFSGGHVEGSIDVTKEYLELPPTWQQKLHKITKGQIKEHSDVLSRINAVKHYLLQNHDYSLSYSPPADSNAMLDFLENSRSAHCEYFATSAVLLLRMVGVPARYVTGLAGGSQGIGYYIYRANNLHAWAEAWDGESWHVVEATPSGGQPNSTQSENLLDWLSFQKDKFFLMNIFDVLANSTLIPYSLALIFLCICLVLLLRALLRHKPWRNKHVSPDINEKIFNLFENKIGIPRELSETLEEYRFRLRSSMQLQEESKTISDSFLGLYSNRVYGEKKVSILELEQMMLHIPDRRQQ